MAIPTMSVTFGVSLARTGSLVAARTPATTPRHIPASVPRSTPWLTFGQEMLSSSAAMPSTPSSRSASPTNSAWEAPAMLTITGAPHCTSQGSWPVRKDSTPSLSSPMELSSPADVSTVLQGTFPFRGSGVTVFGTTPPSRSSETKPAISRP